MPLLHRLQTQQKQQQQKKKKFSRRKGLPRDKIWRLFACTEGARDFSEDEIDQSTATYVSDVECPLKTIGQHRGTKQPTIFRRIKPPAHSQVAHHKTESLTDDDNGSEVDNNGACEDSACGEKQCQLNRKHARHHHHHHHHVHGRHNRSTCQSVCSKGDVASPNCTAGIRRHCRSKKRLMVAMLEDGATESYNDCPSSCNRGKMRVRTTNDEVSIRRIFHQLSATMDAEYRSDSPLDIPRSNALRTAYNRNQIGNAASPRTSRTMTLPSSPLPLPSSTLACQVFPPPLPPRPSAIQQQHQQQSPTTFQQPSTEQPQTQQPSPPPPPPPRAAPQQPASSPSLQLTEPGGWLRVPVQSTSEQSQLEPGRAEAAAGACNQSQKLHNRKSAIRGSGCRGYRLFRRVFSASDNYYAAPFPPMETIRLSNDEDQWEDLEILVTGHNGVKAIKPQLSLL